MRGNATAGLDEVSLDTHRVTVADKGGVTFDQVTPPVSFLRLPLAFPPSHTHCSNFVPDYCTSIKVHLQTIDR